MWNGFRSRGPAGVVLLLVVAVLALMSMMGATFAAMARVERTVARNYVDLVRARMLAESGVEMAVGRLSKDAMDPSRWGAWAYGSAGTPLERARVPSYAGPAPVSVDGATVGESLSLAGTYVADGDFAAVRVTESSSRFPLDIDNPRMSAMIATLVRSAGLPIAVAAGLEKYRGSATMVDLRDRLLQGGFVDAAGWEEVRQLVSIGAWRDPDVVDPVPLTQRRKPNLVAAPPMPAVGAGIPPVGGSYVYTWEELRPTGIPLAKRGRPPVYLQEAPRPVIVALIAGLQGFYLDEESFAKPIGITYDMCVVKYSYTGPDGCLGMVRLTTPISFAQAGAIADALIARRAVAPFREWQDLEWFMKGTLVSKGLLDVWQADAVLANANPNTCSNLFNPPHERARWVDKTSLTAWSTEFSLLPTGTFEVESLGRVLGRAHETVAQARVATSVRLFDLWRETSQKEFLREFWRDGKAIQGNIISRNRGAGATKDGLSLCTYPELPVAQYVRDCDWEGYIELAPKKAPRGDSAFLANYEGSIAPDTGQAVVPDVDGPYVDRLLTGPKAPVGKLYPDGVYSELDSVPMYAFQPASIYDFATSMWVKPHYFPEHAGRTRVYLTWQSTAHNWQGSSERPLGIYQIVSSHREEMSLGGYFYKLGWDPSVVLGGGTIREFEDGVATPCINHRTHGHDGITRFGVYWGNLLDAGRWIHIAWLHTQRRLPPSVRVLPGGTHNEVDVLYIDGKKVGAPYTTNMPDVEVPSDHAGEPMRLGERRFHPYDNSVPDATIDGVQVWDAIDLAKADQKMTEPYFDGRYYAEDDGTFRSGPIDPGQGRPVRYGWAAWTVLRPEGMDGAKVVLDLVETSSGKSVLQGGPSGLAGGAALGVITRAAVRYTVAFVPGVPFGQPVVASPILDDVTIAYTTGPRFLSWWWE